MKTQEFYFSLHLNYQECIRYYNGSVRFIQVNSENGKSIRIPAKNVIKFISSIGISGRFKLCLSDENSLISLEKVT